MLRGKIILEKWHLATTSVLIIILGLYSLLSNLSSNASFEVQCQKAAHDFASNIYERKAAVYRTEFEVKARALELKQEENIRLAQDLTQTRQELKLVREDLKVEQSTSASQTGMARDWKHKAKANIDMVLGLQSQVRTLNKHKDAKDHEMLNLTMVIQGLTTKLQNKKLEFEGLQLTYKHLNDSCDNFKCKSTTMSLQRLNGDSNHTNMTMEANAIVAATLAGMDDAAEPSDWRAMTKLGAEFTRVPKLDIKQEPRNKANEYKSMVNNIMDNLDKASPPIPPMPESPPRIPPPLSPLSPPPVPLTLPPVLKDSTTPDSSYPIADVAPGSLEDHPSNDELSADKPIVDSAQPSLAPTQTRTPSGESVESSLAPEQTTFMEPTTESASDNMDHELDSASEKNQVQSKVDVENEDPDADFI